MTQSGAWTTKNKEEIPGPAAPKQVEVENQGVQRVKTPRKDFESTMWIQSRGPTDGSGQTAVAKNTRNKTF